MDVRGQVPFLRLLIPIVVGILFIHNISCSANLSLIGILGIALIIYSFFKSKESCYSLRWIFGAGLTLSLFFFSTQYYNHFNEFSSYNFPQKECSYIGEVLDIPQQKKRSIACEVQLNYPVNKKTLLYFEPDDKSQQLQPGDLIVVRVFIKPFKNLGNPNEFDYKLYMQHKGFSGTAFVSGDVWINTGKTSRSIRSTALRARAKLLNLYNTFGFSNDEYAFLSALTLGYKADLSNEIKQAFITTGTSHVLAVSGLHVGVVYFIIGTLFFFLKGKGKRFFLKHVFILLILWGYVFITGMPVSVIRAAIMLTLFSVASMFHRKGYHYNTLAIAAFFILIINPNYLFDIGFQLSFVAVFSILYFQPKLSKLHTPTNKASKYVWDLMTVSLAAQLGVFPLGLYYFGTFPIYFFISNLLVIPLIGVVIYLAFTLSIVSFLNLYHLGILDLIQKILKVFLEISIKLVLGVIYFFESLPFAIIEGSHITIVQVCVIFIMLLSLTFFIFGKRAKLLIIFLSSTAFLFATFTFALLNTPHNKLVVYNSYSELEMGYVLNGKKIKYQEVSNKVIAHPKASIILLTDNLYKSKISDNPLSIDYLILASDNNFSINELYFHFKPKNVIICPSISRYAVDKIKRECLKMEIPFHDISDSGAYSINF